MCLYDKRETEAWTSPPNPPNGHTRSHWPVVEPRIGSRSVLPTPALLSHSRMDPPAESHQRLPFGLWGRIRKLRDTERKGRERLA